MRVRLPFGILLASLAFASGAAGQASRPKTDLERVLTEDDAECRLRIRTVQGDTLEGTLFSYRGGVLQLMDQDGDERRVRSQEIAEIWKGGWSKDRGAVAGGVTGTLLGMFLGMMLVGINPPVPFSQPPDPTGEDYARAALVGAFLGGFTGAAIGTALAPGEWKPLYP
jgi:hypothetical protein